MFDRVEDVDDVFAPGCDEAYADAGAAVEVEVVCFGDGHVILSLQFGNDRPDDRAFLLQRVHIAEQQVEFGPANPHGLSVSGLQR